MACSAADVAPVVATYAGTTMGTTYTVRVVVASPTPEPVVGDDIQRMLDSIDVLMSTYDAASEVSRFNAARTTEPFPMSADTMAVIGRALDISLETGGAFDITVGPLVDAWGFGPTVRGHVLPTDNEVARLLTRVGSMRLELDLDGGTVRKDTPELAVDLSAIAKGHAVDRVAEILSTHGIDRYMIEVGGEVRTAGVNERGGVWRIGIERPDPSGASIQRVVELGDAALATSGDYRNFYEVDGRRLSHTIDPRTGRPVTHALAAVSVIDESCARADALATALEVLGPDEGYALASERGWSALFLVRDDAGGFTERETPGFTTLMETSETRSGVVQ